MARKSTTILALGLWALGSGATLATEAEVRVVGEIAVPDAK